LHAEPSPRPPNEVSVKGTRILITVVAVAVGAVHLAVPSLRIDVVTLCLLVLALLPWLGPVIKSVELPGGFAVELQDVRSAAERIISPTGPGQERARRGEPAPEHASPDEIAQLRAVGHQDPNLAIVGLRIAVEKRLRAAAERRGIETERRSATWLLRELSGRGILPGELADGLADLMTIASQAAHGAKVESDAASYALEAAPWVLAALDEHLAT
jgi:hypothetical protein